MSDVISLGSTLFGLKWAFEGVQSLMKAFIPYEDQVGQRSDTDKFQESTYGRPIPIIYGPNNRIAGNVIYYNGITEKKNQIKHSNGTFGSSTYTIWYTYYMPRIAIAIGGNIRNIKRIWANGKLIFTNTYIADIPDAGWSIGPGGRVFSNLYLFKGSNTQVRNSGAIPDSTKPGYQGISYVVMRNFWLDDFGNAVPQFEFEVDGYDWTVYSLINDICIRSGMTSDEYEISLDLMQYNVQGYIISTQSNGLDAIKTLAEVYPFDIAETPDKIYFKSRAKTVACAIELTDLNANIGQAKSDSPFKVRRINDYGMPKSTTVTYIDSSRNYEKSTQIASRSGGIATNKNNRDFGLTLDSATARKIADRLLWTPIIERLDGTIRTNIGYDVVVPGDYIGLPVGNTWVPFRVNTKKRGSNGIIEFDLICGDPSVYDGSTAGEDATPGVNDELGVSELDIYLFNAPLLESGGQPESANWVSNADTGTWRGGSLYRSTDGGTIFYDTGIAQTRNVTGVVQNAIGNAPQGSDTWDRANSITVILDYDNHELNSYAESSILNGINRIWVGKTDGSTGEVIHFATATLTNSVPKTYVLTNLLRGQRGTEYAISGHVANEIFVLITDQVINSVNYGYADIGNSWLYKGVPSYFDPAEIVTTQSFTNTGERARSRSPVQARGERDSSNNLTGYFIRRTKLFPPGVGYGPVELDETTESYEIDIYNVAFTTVLRTITSTTQSFTYSAANQTADGLTPGNNVNCKIYQMSPNVGRGHAGVFTI